ncbi:MAG: acyltransferase [Henriciella sp.]|nr:acyltransferase [Henriciella sp.]
MSASENRFDLLRLVFATLVFVYHGAVLTSGGELTIWHRNLGVLAELAIQGFFIASGALVYGSLERSREIADYAGKRIRRLYPAYVVVILVPTVIAIVINWENTDAMAQIARYFGANLLFLNFLQPNLPGLFEDHAITAVNGALWTLKIEVMFYMVLPFVAAILTRLARYWWIGLLILYVGGWIWSVEAAKLEHPFAAQIARQLPGQMAYFASGMALWKLWPVARARPVALLFVGLTLLVGSFVIAPLEILRAAALAAVIAGIAFMPGPTIRAARWGDVSYGIYITHFPIVQGLVALGILSALPLLGQIALPAALVLLASYVLWWTVERPSLRRDSHYRNA